MANLFSPKIQVPPPPPPPPDQNDPDLQAKRRAKQRELAAAQGRSANILGGAQPQSGGAMGNPLGKTLTGY